MTLPGQTSGESGSGSITTPALIGVVITLAIMVGAVVVLTVLNRPVDNLLVILGSLVIPTITTMLAARKLDAHSTQLNQVASNVNGKMSALISAKTDLEEQVRSLGATPVTVDEPKHSAPDPTPPAESNNNG